MSDPTERLRALAEEWWECCGDIHVPLTEAADALEAAEKRITELEHAYEVLAHSCSDEAEVAGWKLHTAEAKLAAIDALPPDLYDDDDVEGLGSATFVKGYCQGYDTAMFAIRRILHPKEGQ